MWYFLSINYTSLSRSLKTIAIKALRQNLESPSNKVKIPQECKAVRDKKVKESRPYRPVAPVHQRLSFAASAQSEENM